VADPQTRLIELLAFGSFVAESAAGLAAVDHVQHVGFAGAAVPPALRDAGAHVQGFGSVPGPVSACLTQSYLERWVGSDC